MLVGPLETQWKDAAPIIDKRPALPRRVVYSSQFLPLTSPHHSNMLDWMKGNEPEAAG